jgi:hypothetical protein
MASKHPLTSETICDLDGQPLDRRSAALLKAVDKLLTIGAYYSSDHDQYRLVSEETCGQMVEAIRPDRSMAIEITASGLMIRSQLVDPSHRNVRLLHELLVPLNIAQLEFSADLTAADLRLTITALQLHRQALGNTEGFQEVRIDNLPPTVCTASRSVVLGDGKDGLTDAEHTFSLDDLFASDSPGGKFSEEDFLLSESEKLARQFLALVGDILENLEREEDETRADGSPPHPGSSPENIQALREALKRLVEVNPDPADLARLIEHAQRALDLSKDPGSVDLVFSLLKKEIDRGGDWKSQARKSFGNRQYRKFNLTLDQLGQAVAELEVEGSPPAEVCSSSLSNYLGINIQMLVSDPSEDLETILCTNLERIITGRDLTRQDVDLCSTAVATAAPEDNVAVLDRLLPALCRPLRVHRPDYLARFWIQLWETLDSRHHHLVWPHLVNDLLLGLEGVAPKAVESMWLASGQVDSKLAVTQVSRLEQTPALCQKAVCPVLMGLPLTAMYSVHLTLMKSSQALLHGPRLHEQLLRHPPNGLTEILMRCLGQYHPDYESFYLSLIKQSGGDSITPDLRRMAARLICEGLAELPASDREESWVPRAITWLGKLDPGFARPQLTGILKDRRLFFFRAWPPTCRDLARDILQEESSRPVEDDKE